MLPTDRPAASLPPAEVLTASYLRPHELAARGVTRHLRQRLVAEGRLVRLRRGRFVAGTAPDELQEAGHLGGRLDCVSLLALLGVFVRASGGPHLQFEAGSSRLPVRPEGVAAHWRRSDEATTSLTTDLVGALVQACRCQAPRDAIASLDSAWHQGLVNEAAIDAVFARLPRRYRRLRRLVDPRAESGIETLVRLMLRALGCRVDLQVRIDGVGRVDLIANGWLIVECDSRAHHRDWDAHRRDRRRDLAAAAQGYTTVRVLAEDVLWRYEEVLTQLKAALSHTAPRQGLHNSFDLSEPAAQAREIDATVLNRRS